MGDEYTGSTEWPFSHRISAARHSPTVRLNDAAKRLALEGQDVILLGGGEPDFETPEWIVDAAIAALKRGETRYTPVDGTVELRDAIRGRLARAVPLRCESGGIPKSVMG
jgi:aspartate aminotransferase